MINENQRTSAIRTVRTLGPSGSNLESASWEWLRRSQIDGTVELHATVEEAVAALDGATEAVMACAAYPALHDVVFKNLDKLTIVDAFVMPTHNMVLATRPGTVLADDFTCVSHPAPRSLIPDTASWVPSTSNSQAALDCAEGRADACITTSVGAQDQGLVLVKDFGTVDMAFTLHATPSVGH